jgi:hypothetical protein
LLIELPINSGSVDISRLLIIVLITVSVSQTYPQITKIFDGWFQTKTSKKPFKAFNDIPFYMPLDTLIKHYPNGYLARCVPTYSFTGELLKKQALICYNYNKKRQIIGDIVSVQIKTGEYSLIYNEIKGIITKQYGACISDKRPSCPEFEMAMGKCFWEAFWKDAEANMIYLDAKSNYQANGISIFISHFTKELFDEN